MNAYLLPYSRTRVFLSTKIIPGSYSARTHAGIAPHKVLLKYRIGLNLLHAYRHLHNFTFMHNVENVSPYRISVHIHAAHLRNRLRESVITYNGIIYSRVSGIILARRIKYRLTRASTFPGGCNIENKNVKKEREKEESI